MAIRASKILRIGVVVGGKIVAETLVKQGDPVTIGPAASNTFCYPGTGVTTDGFTLFREGHRGVELRIASFMRGRISLAGGAVSLKALRGSNAGVESLSLADTDRGKLVLGEVTLLFQFVDPPPLRAVLPLHKMTFRARVLEDDDPVFLGFLAVNAAMAAVLCVVVANAPPKASNPHLDVLPPNIARVLAHVQVVEPEPTPDVEPVDEVEPKKPEVKKVAKIVPVVPEPEPDVKRPSKETREQRTERVRDSMRGKWAGVLKGPNLADRLGVIGTKGITESNEKAGRMRVSATEGGLRGSSVGTGDARGGALQKLGNHGAVTLDDDLGPLVYTLIEPPTIEAEPQDVASIAGVVKAGFFQLTGCYEQELKRDPELAGRIEVDFTVESGRVTDAYVSVNGTGNQPFASCVSRRIKRWQFPHGVTADVSYPFVFRPK